MGVKMTKEEYAAYAESRKGVTAYRVCHVENGKKVADEKFDAPDDDAARKHVAEYAAGRGGGEYFWEYAREFVIAHEDGTFELSESPMGDDFEKELAEAAEKPKPPDGAALVHGDFLEFLRTYDYSRGRSGVYVPDEYGIVEDPYENEKRAYDDIAHMLKSYDPETGEAHTRREAWSLDTHVLGDLEYNIPLIMEDKHGVPTLFCQRAREELGPAEGKDPYNFDEKETLRGKELWNEELARLLEHVWLYNLYSWHGIVDESGGEKAVAFQTEHLKDIPYRPGSYKEIDYIRLSDMAQAEWKAIWSWMAEYGQSLWT